MLIPELYRKIEKENGRSLKEIGSAGVGFMRENVLRAIEYLNGSQVGVLGGDVLKMVDGRLQYTYDNWHVDKKPGEDVLAYLRRSLAETVEYIRQYPDPGDGSIMYSLVISELGL